MNTAISNRTTQDNLFAQAVISHCAARRLWSRAHSHLATLRVVLLYMLLLLCRDSDEQSSKYSDGLEHHRRNWWRLRTAGGGWMCAARAQRHGSQTIC
eukprot:3102-Heterococcus_DN1.PRE.2